MFPRPCLGLLALVLPCLPLRGAADAEVFPGRAWSAVPPAAAGLDAGRLADFTHSTGGRGVVVRGGRLAFTWGEFDRRGDVASACKPLFTHFLLLALAEGRIPSLDEPVMRLEPRLAELNAGLGFKDRGITWRHLATQTSGYGMREAPGAAFAYNDWQMALLWDVLFPRVYGVPPAEADARVLEPLLNGPLGCEDEPAMVPGGNVARAGRLAVSPRDFARLGLLYLREGRWDGRQILPAEMVRLATRSPLPAALPRAGTNAAAMLPGQRSLGSRRIPDNQTDHFGGYSMLWWVNGLDRDGRRHWLDAPADTFAALGHGGIRALVVIPSLDLVVSWNDATPDSPAGVNAVLRQLTAAVTEPRVAPPAGERLRVIIETDAGGDPDDEQSLVRWLLCANEWDVEGIIANRPRARDGENLNPERTGPGIVHRLLDAYAACWTNLVRHDPRYPAPDSLRARTVAGDNDTDDAVKLLLGAVDSSDPRPVWYSDWGTDHGAATNNLRRALDLVLRERGPEGYARFKERLRLSSADAFGDHTWKLQPPFPLWVDTWRPEMEGRRWYHRFSALTATAGGFDVVRDVLTGHGPLGALYPTNTTHWCKEGDSLSFIYLLPVGLGDPEDPTAGGWGGRLGPREGAEGRRYFWASQRDTWNGSTHRDHTLARWAPAIQNDFRARLDWCVRPPAGANHPPAPRVQGTLARQTRPGERVDLDATLSADPDGDALAFRWEFYPEAGDDPGGTRIEAADQARAWFTAPRVPAPRTFHVILTVTDAGEPALSRHARVRVTVAP